MMEISICFSWALGSAVIDCLAYGTKVKEKYDRVMTISKCSEVCHFTFLLNKVKFQLNRVLNAM